MAPRAGLGLMKTAISTGKQTSQRPAPLDRSLDTTQTELSWFESRRTSTTFSGELAKKYRDSLLQTNGEEDKTLSEPSSYVGCAKCDDCVACIPFRYITISH
jgi:hypothetical protein